MAITEKQKDFVRIIQNRSGYPPVIGLNCMTKSEASELITHMLKWESENHPDPHQNVDIEGDLGQYDG